MAPVLGVRLAETASEKLEIPLSQHTLWTDSMDEVYWIQGHLRRLKSFVANRVADSNSTEIGPSSVATCTSRIKPRCRRNKRPGPEKLIR